jgi:integrase
VKTKMPKYIDRFVDRFGVARYYFRRKGGPRIALPGLPYSTEFMDAYQAASTDQGLPRLSTRNEPGSVGAALVDYYASAMWADLSDGSRKFRRPILERFREQIGAGKLRAVERKHIQNIIAKRPPSAQGNVMKALRHFFKWAVSEELISNNPTGEVVTKRKPVTGGFRPWEENNATAYRAFYQVGTVQRLAMELMLNLGIRVSDAARIGPRDISNGVLVNFQPHKGRDNGGHKINVPLHDDLLRVIAATPLTGTHRFLIAPRGGVFSAEYLSQCMREWCDAAGIPACTSHGLRKLCLTRLAEAGCSAFEIMAVSGHKNLKEVMTYVDAANRKKLAGSAMVKLVADQKAN